MPTHTFTHAHTRSKHIRSVPMYCAGGQSSATFIDPASFFGDNEDFDDVFFTDVTHCELLGVCLDISRVASHLKNTC